jgi:hypothetical protein
MFPQFLRAQRSAEVSCNILVLAAQNLRCVVYPRKRDWAFFHRNHLEIIALEAKNDGGTGAIHDISSATMF